MKHRPMKGIAGIGEQRQRMLAEVGINTAAELAAAVPATVHGQLVGNGHRVRVDEVAKWVEAAKRTIEASWQRAATFVVSFESMPDTTPDTTADDRRTVVERTEVDEDPAPATTWTGWNCSELCAWMRAQLGSEPDADEQSEREQPEQTTPVEGALPTEPAKLAEPAAPANPGPPTRRHQFFRAEIVDRLGQERLLVTDGSAVASTTPIVLPARITLITASPHDVRAQIWIRLRPLVSERAAILLGPVSPRSTNGEEVMIDLPGEMTPGDYEMTIVVADADGAAAPVTVALTRAVLPSR